MKTSKCHCDWCIYWHPIIKQVRSKLKGHDLRSFDSLIEHYEAASLDGDIAEAKLNGSWPGWEWLPKVIEQQNKKNEHKRNKSPLK